MTPIRFLPIAAAAFTLGACSPQEQDRTAGSSNAAAAEEGSMQALTPAERADGWRSLFDGRNADMWRGFRSDSLPSGWRVVDGALARVAEAGDIVTRDQFGDFELALEWRVEAGGNSGIFYRVDEQVGAAAYESGPEMQVLDDAGHADGRSRLTAAGSLYGLYPAREGVVRPAGEWNEARIVVDGNNVEHWLNGEKLADAEIGSDDWTRRVAESKFAEWPAFARASRGHIGLQDHGDPVQFRHIRIRQLDRE